MIHQEQALVVQYVPVIVVVEYHGGAPVVPHVLYGLWVRDRVWTLVEHVLYVVGIEGWVDLRV